MCEIAENRPKRSEPWSKKELRVIRLIHALGVDTDPVVAAHAGVCRKLVARVRSYLGIPPFGKRPGVQRERVKPVCCQCGAPAVDVFRKKRLCRDCLNRA